MNKKDSKSIRYHFSAPAADTQISEWAEHQHNLSISIRLVLKDFIARHGLIDVSCLPIMPLTNDCPPTISKTSVDTAQNSVNEPASAPVQTAAEPVVTDTEPVSAPVTAPASETSNSKARSMLDDLIGGN